VQLLTVSRSTALSSAAVANLLWLQCHEIASEVRIATAVYSAAVAAAAAAATVGAVELVLLLSMLLLLLANCALRDRSTAADSTAIVVTVSALLLIEALTQAHYRGMPAWQHASCTHCGGASPAKCTAMKALTKAGKRCCSSAVRMLLMSLSTWHTLCAVTS
jgi:hypothetical protein